MPDQLDETAKDRFEPVYLLVPLGDGIVDSGVITAQFANGLEDGRPERSVEVPSDAVIQLVYSGLVGVASHGALRKRHSPAEKWPGVFPKINLRRTSCRRCRTFQGFRRSGFAMQTLLRKPGISDGERED
jgi:hypothetical protein